MQPNRIFDIFRVVVNVNLGSSVVTHRPLQDHWAVTSPLSKTSHSETASWVFLILIWTCQASGAVFPATLHFQVRVGKLDQKFVSNFFFLKERRILGRNRIFLFNWSSACGFYVLYFGCSEMPFPFGFVTFLCIQESMFLDSVSIA